MNLKFEKSNVGTKVTKDNNIIGWICSSLNGKFVILLSGTDFKSEKYNSYSEAEEDFENKYSTIIQSR